MGNINLPKIKNKIHNCRNVPIMLDSDLAEIYQVKTKVLNQAVKRNIERFPRSFMFQLTEEEYRLISNSGNEKDLRSQVVTIKNNRGKHRKYLPYAFTEQGVSMLSAVLKSKTAIKISIQIMKAFVAMRKFHLENTQIFHRLDRIELKQIEYESKFDKIFVALQPKQPKKGIFFDGQIFDSYKFVCDLIKSAKSSIILIDTYIDENVLMLFSKRKKNVSVTIYTNKFTKQLDLDIKKFHQQYPKISIKHFKLSHDRFLLIDEKEVYHFGASIKDLGKKWFAFSKFNNKSLEILYKLKIFSS